MQAYAISHFLYPYFRLPMHFSKGNETLNCCKRRTFNSSLTEDTIRQVKEEKTTQTNETLTRYSLVCQVFWLRIGDSVDNTACDLA